MWQLSHNQIIEKLVWCWKFLSRQASLPNSPILIATRINNGFNQNKASHFILQVCFSFYLMLKSMKLSKLNLTVLYTLFRLLAEDEWKEGLKFCQFHNHSTNASFAFNFEIFNGWKLITKFTIFDTIMSLLNNQHFSNSLVEKIKIILIISNFTFFS